MTNLETLANVRQKLVLILFNISMDHNYLYSDSVRNLEWCVSILDNIILSSTNSANNEETVSDFSKVLNKEADKHTNR